MSDKVQFELVSPERLLSSELVDMVVVPGSEGYLGVLPDMSPLIATLQPGTIDIYKGTEIQRRIFVAGGFVEVSNSKCTVLAETAIDVAQLHRANIEQEIKDLNEDVADAKSDDERAKAEAALLLAKARLQAVTGELVV
ncbi:F0F1 ATP synthase subunit epsilon [Radicibacter daui]|uniref:F0F1 ATP synthase subunit epsilon n=1 Tax=Radicibacter daui TaxID=3064829 RepID=UPI004046ECA5